jgi:hypothetical protein
MPWWWPIDEVETSCQTTNDRKQCVMCDWKFRYTLTYYNYWPKPENVNSRSVTSRSNRSSLRKKSLSRQQISILPSFYLVQFFAWRWPLRLKHAADCTHRYCFYGQKTVVLTVLFWYTVCWLIFSPESRIQWKWLALTPVGHNHFHPLCGQLQTTIKTC